MNVLLLHYHLKTGGVATVIRRQVGMIEDACRLLVISGETPPPDFPVPVHVVPEIAYGTRGTVATAKTAAGKIRALIRTHLSGRCDILHVHNPLLAKNNIFLDTLTRLQDDGVRLLLQVHDFSEDGRPGFYFRAPYPRDCHYAVINSRDFGFLRSSGLHPDGLHLLPNMVSDIGSTCRETTGGVLVLYPVRALRRKNLGEAILLSQFLAPGLKLAVTLPPNSDSDVKSYRDWKSFAQAHRSRFPMVFDIGVGQLLADLIPAARYLITTSISEGFGFSFLEPWTFGKAVFGRRLPGVCEDFERAGLRLDHLYADVRIPRDWIDDAAYVEKWRRHFAGACRHYGVSPENVVAESDISAVLDRRFFDFGMLDEGAQRQVLQGIDRRPSLRDAIRADNPLFASPGDVKDARETIRRNSRVVNRVYGRAACRRQLLSVYDRVMRRDVHHGIDKNQLIRHFLKPDNFSLLKWSPYAG